MHEKLAFKLESNKPFDEVVTDLEKQTAEHKFRVLAVHDVQGTLAEKGLQRGPLKIVEVCNAVFAHEATGKEIAAAMFMPCRFTVHTDKNKTIVTLARPAMIAELLPGAGLDELAARVEDTLKDVMKAAI